MKKLCLILIVVTCYSQDLEAHPDEAQPPLNIAWWKTRARIKKIFTGSSIINVRWRMPGPIRRISKRSLDPLLIRKI